MMKTRFLSSITISLGLAIAVTALYAGFARFYQPNGWYFAVWILFFLFSFIIFFWVLEKLVFSRLKNEQQLSQKEIRKLKELENYRRDFLAEVSHELKTPIFATQGFLHTLMDGAMDDPKVRLKFLKKALKNADRLANLVQDLHLITQAESGEMVMRMRPFEVPELVMEVVDLMDLKFSRKGRNIKCSIVNYAPDNIQTLADRERIQQVLTNLVDNAVKYGNPFGHIVIDITKSEGKIWIAVTDDGPGIAEEHISLLFRRFYRVDKSRSRERGGTGLGLAICKHLIEAHGETIEVKSTVGRGTTFRFSLKPLANGFAPATTPMPPSANAEEEPAMD